jgi:hypothetical protein
MKKCNIVQALSTRLSGTLFSTLKNAEINDPERPEKQH